MDHGPAVSEMYSQTWQQILGKLSDEQTESLDLNNTMFENNKKMSHLTRYIPT